MKSKILRFLRNMTVNKIFGLMAVIFTASFGWIFLFKHIPLVVWVYVFQHWVSYALILVAGTGTMFLFYAMAKVCEILSIQCEDDKH
jgi:hypothetical protein